MLLEFFYCQKRMLFSQVSWKGKVKYLLFRSKHKDIQWHLYYLSKYCDFRFIFVVENFKKQNGSFAFWRHIGLDLMSILYCPVSMLNIKVAAQFCLKDKIWPIWEGNKVVQVYFPKFVCMVGCRAELGCTVRHDACIPSSPSPSSLLPAAIVTW